MAKEFFWDLGFDFDADQNENGECELVAGFEESGTTVVSSMTGIHQGDTLTFNLFNIGSGESFSIKGVTIEFRNALTGPEPACPILGNQEFKLGDDSNATVQFDNSGNAIIPVESHVGTETPSTSPVFGTNSLPSWAITKAITLDNDGDFLVSISLVVQQGEGESAIMKIYSADPEMVVGSGTMGGDGELQGAERGNQPVIARVGT